jgi:hypothetical protein
MFLSTIFALCTSYSFFFEIMEWFTLTYFFKVVIPFQYVIRPFIFLVLELGASTRLVQQKMHYMIKDLRTSPIINIIECPT